MPKLYTTEQFWQVYETLPDEEETREVFSEEQRREDPYREKAE